MLDQTVNRRPVAAVNHSVVGNSQETEHVLRMGEKKTALLLPRYTLPLPETRGWLREDTPQFGKDLSLAQAPSTRSPSAVSACASFSFNQVAVFISMEKLSVLWCQRGGNLANL